MDGVGLGRWKVPFVALMAVLVGSAMLASAETSALNPGRLTGTDQAVALGVNVAHSGSVVGSTLTPPLVMKWTMSFPGYVSYPLMAEGMVFVTAGKSKGFQPYGTYLYALDAMTGSTIWRRSISGIHHWSEAAYDSGRLFVLSDNTHLSAYDAATGATVWQVSLESANQPYAPTAADGIVYVNGFYAISEDTGDTLWIGGGEGSDASSPALSDTAVFSVDVGPHVGAWDRFTGQDLWKYSFGGSGGGAYSPVYHQGRLYVRDWTVDPHGFVLDATTGDLLARYNPPLGPPPAFAENVGLFPRGDRLLARDLLSGSELWRFPGDRNLSSNPVVANGYVYVGSTLGNLFALDVTTGQNVWTVNVGAPIPIPDETWGQDPTPLMAVGGGLLVVPVGSDAHADQLVAFGN